MPWNASGAVGFLGIGLKAQKSAGIGLVGLVRRFVALVRFPPGHVAIFGAWQVEDAGLWNPSE